MTHIYPPFIANQAASEFLPLFEEERILNPQPPSKVVVSTSLYWSQRAQGKWQSKYLGPLLKGCEQQLPEGWSRRIYMSADTAREASKIPPHVEVRIMKNSSLGSIPGMLWRYLPITENVFCFARGADNWTLYGWEIKAANKAIESQAHLYRHVWNHHSVFESKYLLYRTVRGTCGIQGPLPFLEAATQWIAFNKRQRPAQNVEDKIHYGLKKWDSFGQDEQFLCRWLYYIMANKPTLTLVTPSEGSDLFRKDMEYLYSNGMHHKLAK